MSNAKFKQINGGILMAYPVLREPGITTPAKYGRVILSPVAFTNLFQGKPSEKLTVELAGYFGSTLLAESLNDERFKDEDRVVIVNQHIDLAEAYLLHHSKRLPSLYKDNIADFHGVRGGYLKEVALQDDAGMASLRAYGYWANSYAQNLAETNPKQCENLRQDAEDVFRMAHEANHIVGTEALGTFLYATRMQTEEPIALWEKAAAAGNAIAIHNLFNAVVKDEGFCPEDHGYLLTSIWEGIAKNKKETADVAKALKKAGYLADVALNKTLTPA